MTTFTPSTLFSQDVISVLKSRGMTLKQIGNLLNLSESFISRVARGERGLTMHHLGRLEKQLGESLALLLVEAQLPSVPPEWRDSTIEVISILRRSWALQKELERGLKSVSSTARKVHRSRSHARVPARGAKVPAGAR